MRLIIEQEDLVRMCKAYVEHLGYAPANVVEVDFKATRRNRTSGEKNPTFGIVKLLEPEDTFKDSTAAIGIAKDTAVYTEPGFDDPDDEAPPEEEVSFSDLEPTQEAQRTFAGGLSDVDNLQVGDQVDLSELAGPSSKEDSEFKPEGGSIFAD